MPNHAGSQDIDISIPFISIQPDLPSLPRERLGKLNVIYSWTDDDREEFELKSVRPRSNLTPKEAGLAVAGEYRGVPLLQKHPGHPLAVVFQAMKAANPDWRCDHVDIIAQSDLLNLIYLWISGDHTSSFVIDASLVRNTLCITLLKDEKPSSDSQEDESPSPSPTTIGQHHILEYSFAGLNLLVTSPGHLVYSVATNEVHFARILQTSSRAYPYKDVLPLLWFSGTPTCVSGSVSDGVFEQYEQWHVPKKMREWEGKDDTREHLKAMIWLLQYVRTVTSWQMFSGSCSIRFEVSGGHKRVEFYAASRAQQLPTLFGKFWDYN